jgi:hypothetical protein
MAFIYSVLERKWALAGLLVALRFLPASSHAARVTLAWDANSEPDVAGYKIHYGPTSRTYSFVVEAGNVTTHTISNLQEGLTYFFAATAYSSAGLESDFSEEVSHTVPLSPRIATTATLVSSRNPAAPGETVTFTFTVRAVATTLNILSGPVRFRIDQSSSSGLLIGGVATFSTSSLPVGTHVVTAEYAGDLNFLGVTNGLSPEQLVNTPPIAGTDELPRYLPNGVKVRIASLLGNDSDADGHVIRFVSFSATSANGGTITRDADWLYYTAPVGFTNDDSFTYAIEDGLGQPVTGLVNIRITEHGGSPNLKITALDDGSFSIRFDGVPGAEYRIDYLEDPSSTNWQTLGSRMADDTGLFEITDTPPPGSPMRVYRSASP